MCIVAFLIQVSLLWTHAGTSQTKEGLVKPPSAPMSWSWVKAQPPPVLPTRTVPSMQKVKLKKIMLIGTNGEALQNSKRGKCQ